MQNESKMWNCIRTVHHANGIPYENVCDSCAIQNAYTKQMNMLYFGDIPLSFSVPGSTIYPYLYLLIFEIYINYEYICAWNVKTLEYTKYEPEHPTTPAS